MKKNEKKIFLLLSVLSLLMGGLIYIFFRTSTLKMFTWLDKLGLSETLRGTRDITLQYSDELPKWLVYSLPDGLWIFSYVCLMLYIWADTAIKKSLTWILVVPIIAILSELGQAANLVSGTFDIIDLLFYIIFSIIPFLLHNFLTKKN